MFYSPRKKKMNNGQARYNIVFGDERKEQYLSNYDGEQATNTIVVDHENDTLFSVEPFDELPYLSGIRAGLPKIQLASTELFGAPISGYKSSCE